MLLGAFLLASALTHQGDVTFEWTGTNGDSRTFPFEAGKLVLKLKDGACAWRFVRADGTTPQDPYWWERTDYTPAGRFAGSFQLSPFVADWSAAMAAEGRSAIGRPLVVREETLPRFWLYYLDGILLHAEPRLAGGRTEPFVYRVPMKEPVDVSKSWVREFSCDEFGAPNAGAFGGRWAGALSCTPGRFQFRVPNANWGSLELEVSATNRPFLTVQFYRPGSGLPIDFPVTTIPADGQRHLVRVPLRQDLLSAFRDRAVIEFELTGKVHLYGASPEPAYMSRHGAGEPSGVTVHAMTLREADLAIGFEPEAFGNVWTGMDSPPAYALTLTNRTARAVTADVAVETRAYYGNETTRRELKVDVPAGGAAVRCIELPVEKYGWHAVVLTVGADRYERSFAVLRPRAKLNRPFGAPGHHFGSWPPNFRKNHGHFMPPAYDACRLAFPLGIETFPFGHVAKAPEVIDLARQFGVKDYLSLDYPDIRGKTYEDPGLEERIVKYVARPSDVCEPVYHWLFAEPGGIGPDATLAAVCGAETPVPTDGERAKFADYKRKLLRFSELYRRHLPGKKLLLPWGSPLFTAAFLKDPETRFAFDGAGFDTAFFDRLPEGQVHACSLYTLTLFNREWAKYRSDRPLVVVMEGPGFSREAPESLTPEEHARNLVRANLILSANGVRHLFSCITTLAEPASYYGEQHYGDGAFSRLTLNPHAVYAAGGTLVRLLRPCEFVRVIPTGDLGVFDLEYRNVDDGSSLHVIWCVRGRVPFASDAERAYDLMDNETASRVATPDPIFLVGCKSPIRFGTPVYSADDVSPKADAVRVTSFAGWRQTEGAPDREYLESAPNDIRRYPLAMNVFATNGCLAVALPDETPDRDAYPFVTTLVPSSPVVLPGRPKTLALSVTAAADWGRVVYVLRDAKGERFVSVGRKGVYNVDDTRADSFFNFSGTRFVRMRLPGNRPWDKSRFFASTLWGASGGDGIVDYPLSVEKVLVERRSRAMYVNALVPTARRPVLLGSLYAEEFDDEPNIVRPPAPAAKRRNPIAELAGTLPPTEIRGVREPLSEYDGTRGHFDFREVAEAKAYDIYISPTSSGEGALLLGRGVKASGSLVKGFVAGRDFWAFVVWRDAAGRESRPSAPFKFRLEDHFVEK